MKEDLTLYCDLDGVCCNFYDYVIKILQIEDFVKNKLKDSKKEIPEITGISNNEFWNLINQKDPNFWENIPDFPWTKTFVYELNKIGSVFFCSKPNLSPNSLSGKMKWLQDRYSKSFREYVFTPYKHLLAKNNKTILIDDDPENLKKFAEFGGVAIEFPSRYEIEDIDKKVLDLLKSVDDFLPNQVWYWDKESNRFLGEQVY